MVNVLAQAVVEADRMKKFGKGLDEFVGKQTLTQIGHFLNSYRSPICPWRDLSPHAEPRVR